MCVGKPDFDTKKGKIGWVPKDFLEDSSVLNESCIDHSVDYAVFLPQNMGKCSSGCATVCAPYMDMYVLHVCVFILYTLYIHVYILYSVCVCVCVRVCMCVYVCVSLYVNVCTWIYVSTVLCTYMH